ncbi:putative small GTP-binding protein RAB6 [Trypanosoma grayi]|uniref:putative small GTP-binding protein RAB6 n=1 Tax=Trypanosoma grayi TaxID=71804 RepID=UPI0004F3F549|nr:putative small GTP-binding protein RAB6 [Trypanosoma grayi]KEG12741.1 putative small GTP-binding protein RAB6 [Trypanosoma grayi]
MRGVQECLTHRRTVPRATPCNLVLLGTTGIGKTTLLQQFITGTFRLNHMPTTLETMLHHDEVDDDVYILHLCDCSGSDEFKGHRAPYIAQADGVILTYAIDKKASLLRLVQYAREVQHARKRYGVKVSVPLLVVGTCADKAERREVPLEAAERIAAECMSQLDVRLARRQKKCDADAPTLPCGVSTTHPVLEVACTRRDDVVRAMHVMVRGVRQHRATSRLPTAAAIYPVPKPRPPPLLMPLTLPIVESIPDDASAEDDTTPTIVSFLPQMLLQRSSELKVVNEIEEGTASTKSVGVTHSIDSASEDEEEEVEVVGRCSRVFLRNIAKNREENEKQKNRDQEQNNEPYQEQLHENEHVQQEQCQSRQQQRGQGSERDAEITSLSAWTILDAPDHTPSEGRQPDACLVGILRGRNEVKQACDVEHCPTCHLM